MKITLDNVWILVAGIQIAPNAFHCFDRLGVGDRARSEAVYVDRLRLMD